jgi:hypothetical protein
MKIGRAKRSQAKKICHPDRSSMAREADHAAQWRDLVLRRSKNVQPSQKTCDIHHIPNAARLKK